MSTIQTIPARRGAAAVVNSGQKIKIINTHGNQVVDTWAFAIPAPVVSATDVSAPVYPNATPTSLASYSEAANAAAAALEFMSMSHTRVSTQKLVPEVGDVLVSQKRAPMVKLVEDTSPGAHDTLISACDRWRYANLGVEGYHESCTDNCWDALYSLSTTLSSSSTKGFDALKGLQGSLAGRIPDPLNLFMNIPVTQQGSGAKWSVKFDAPVSKPGDFVILEALRDVVVVMSACPQDILVINGKGPVDAHYIVVD